MVDIHSHILPGLDDGAQTLDDSVTMLKMAEAAGTTDIVATPHSNHEFRFDPMRISEAAEQVKLAYEGPVRIHLGCDFHLSFENLQAAIRDASPYTINHGRYLLVEFPELIIPANAGGILRRLVSIGLRPIITHPERNRSLRQKLNLLEEWVTEGSYLQVTAQSFLGVFGPHAKQFSMRLIRKGIVHIVASDAHDVERRTTRLDEAYKALAGRFSESLAELVFVLNPRAVISDQPIEHVMEPLGVRGQKWFHFRG